MENPLYIQIADAIKAEMLAGRLKPGQRLPSIRQMTGRWKCTPGTVQRAYAELERSGLVVSRPGQGTYAASGEVRHEPGGSLDFLSQVGFRHATLVHRAEAFVLEATAGGYSTSEVEVALLEALDRWRAVVDAPPLRSGRILRFSGSHDPGVAWLAGRFDGIAPGFALELEFIGSLGGLIALAQGRADLAGCHLWDAESGEYNAPFVQRLLPGRRMGLVTLAWRQLGLILPPGNPAQVTGLVDLTRPELRFINRQPGSGTRVWLDAALRREGIDPHTVRGYSDELLTHSAVAVAVAEGHADLGFCLLTSALPYGLDFIELVKERYELVIPEEMMDFPGERMLIEWLATDAARDMLVGLGGYEEHQTGLIRWTGR